MTPPSLRDTSPVKQGRIIISSYEIGRGGLTKNKILRHSRESGNPGSLILLFCKAGSPLRQLLLHCAISYIHVVVRGDDGVVFEL
jgi:hypothetical protein